MGQVVEERLKLRREKVALSKVRENIEPVVADHGRITRIGISRREQVGTGAPENSSILAVNIATISNRSAGVVMLDKSSVGSSPSRKIRTGSRGRRRLSGEALMRVG